MRCLFIKDIFKLEDDMRKNVYYVVIVLGKLDGKEFVGNFLFIVNLFLKIFFVNVSCYVELMEGEVILIDFFIMCLEWYDVDKLLIYEFIY